MYKDLKRHYWWRNIQRDVAKFVSKCLVCQQVRLQGRNQRDYYNHLAYLNESENIAMDFIVDYPGRSEDTQLYGSWLIGSQIQLTFFQGSLPILWINGVNCT